MEFVMKRTCLAKYWLGEIPTTPLCSAGPGISNSKKTCKNEKQTWMKFNHVLGRGKESHLINTNFHYFANRNFNENKKN